jgi:hypothetical protein
MADSKDVDLYQSNDSVKNEIDINQLSIKSLFTAKQEIN